MPDLKRIAVVTSFCFVASAWAQESRPAPVDAMCNVIAFGAVSDGQTKCTAAIQKAIDACAAKGGGTVVIPAGRFVTGALFLKSNLTLQIEPGCVLLGSEDFADYPLIDGRWEGIEVKHHASLINGDGLENIAVTGRGTIDARGKVWWEAVRARKLDAPRGRLIGLYRCTNVRITGVTLRNSPAWTINPIYCDNVTVDGVTVINPANSPNTDGINPDSSRNVHISNCHLDVGDDCITIKSGKNEDGRRVNRPCENITVTNCTMLAGHGGVVIGSEMSGGVNNVVITNCVFDGTDAGIRMKTERGRGGVVQNIRVSNIVMHNVGRAITLNMFYHKVPEEPVSERTPAFRSIHISNITVSGAKQAAELIGLPEKPLADISIVNANFDATKGIRCSDAQGLKLRGVRVQTKEGPAIACQSVQNLLLDDVGTDSPRKDSATIELADVRDAWLHSCVAAEGTGTFCQLKGAKTADVLLSGNHLMVDQPIMKTDDVGPKAVRVE